MEISKPFALALYARLEALDFQTYHLPVLHDEAAELYNAVTSFCDQSGKLTKCYRLQSATAFNEEERTTVLPQLEKDMEVICDWLLFAKSAGRSNLGYALQALGHAASLSGLHMLSRDKGDMPIRGAKSLDAA